VVLALIAGYYLVFFGWMELRRAGWNLLLIPDVLCGQWIGGDPSRVGLLDRLPLLLAASVILLVAAAAGGLLLDALRLSSIFTRLEVWIFALGAGLQALSLITLAIGLGGGLQQRWLFALAAGLILVLGALRRRRLWGMFTGRGDCRFAGGADARKPSAAAGSGWRVRYAMLGAVPFVLVMVLGSMLPPWHFDVREYHAQVPKEWFQLGRITFLPHNVYGNMPLGAEMQLILGMQFLPGADAWWRGTLVGKLVIASFALVTTLAIYGLGRRYVSSAAGAVGALVFVSTPWVAFVSMSGLIEGASACYLTLTLYVLLFWLDEPRESAPSGLTALAGWLAGAAVSCKYPGLFFVAVPAGVVIASRSLVARPWVWRPIAAYVLALACGCGLWLGKNWVLTGNPTYPLLYGWFDGSTRTDAKDEQWSRAHRAPAGGLSLSGLVDSVELLALGSDYASPAVLPFALLGLWSLRKWRWLAIVAGTLGFVLVAWWLLTHRVDRFLLPVLPLACVLAGQGAAWSSTRLWQRAVSGLLVVTLLFNLSLICTQEWTSHGVSVPIACGEAQVFDLEVPVIYNTCFDDCVFEQRLKNRTRAERYSVLKQDRISHVLIKWHELDRYRSPGNYGYSSYVTRALVRTELVEQQRLLRPLRLELDPENVEVFEVVGWETWTD
jgi:hypothetical protein